MLASAGVPTGHALAGVPTDHALASVPGSPWALEAGALLGLGLAVHATGLASV